MTRIEDRLADVLRRAVPEQVDAVSFDGVRRVARRARLTTAAMATVALLAAASVTAVALAVPGQPPPAAVGRPGHGLVFQGITLDVPPGWTMARPSCGWPANDSLVLDNDDVAAGLRCPPWLHAPQPLPTTMTLTKLYGPIWMGDWLGRWTTWHGQPALVFVRSPSGPGVSRGWYGMTVTLPLLNVSVSAESPDPAAVGELLRRVSPRPQPGLAVPRRAASVFIETYAGQTAPHVNVTAPGQVARILADLRALRPAALRRACSATWWPHLALLTVHESGGRARTYAAQFGSCHAVISGTGSAAAPSRRLLMDIERLVPRSGLR